MSRLVFLILFSLCSCAHAYVYSSSLPPIRPVIVAINKRLEKCSEARLIKEKTRRLQEEKINRHFREHFQKYPLNDFANINYETNFLEKYAQQVDIYVDYLNVSLNNETNMTTSNGWLVKQLKENKLMDKLYSMLYELQWTLPRLAKEDPEEYCTESQIKYNFFQNLLTGVELTLWKSCVLFSYWNAVEMLDRWDYNTSISDDEAFIKFPNLQKRMKSDFDEHFKTLIYTSVNSLANCQPEHHNVYPIQLRQRFPLFRYFNLRGMTSDISKNKVVVGLRIQLSKNMFHLQVQQGQLLKYGRVNKKTVEWKPLEEFSIDDPNVTSKDYFQLNYGDNFNFNTVLVKYPAAVTGVKFIRNGHMLSIACRFNEINIDDGTIRNGKKAQDNWIQNLKLREKCIDSTDKSQMISDGCIDFGNISNTMIDNNSVPLLDTREAHSFNAPLSGVGIYFTYVSNYFNGVNGKGRGILSPKLTEFTVY